MRFGTGKVQCEIEHCRGSELSCLVVRLEGGALTDARRSGSELVLRQDEIEAFMVDDTGNVPSVADMPAMLRGWRPM